MTHALNQLRQLYPSEPAFTEKEVDNLDGRVYIVTGASSGVGKQLSRILYGKNAKVYLAARSKDKALAAMEWIEAQAPDSTGELVYLPLDLGDLRTIRASADEFLARESRLHVLFNNAGVMMPPPGSETAQGYDLELGTNNVGPFLLTRLLTPVLAATAASSAPASVRVVWVSSSAAEAMAPRGGPPMDNLDYRVPLHKYARYGISKAGNYLHSTEYARRHRARGIVSVALNPGNLDSDLVRHVNFLERTFFRWFLQHPPVLGAYTELFAGLSPDVTMEKTGAWIGPWGRFFPIRHDLEAASKPTSEGGTGRAQEFWEWTEEQVEKYA